MFYDIAQKGGDIWYACDDADSPIKAFATNGALTDYIWDTVVPAAHGLCFEDDQFLWASNHYTDELYRIDLTPTGIEGEEIQNSLSLVSNVNPFSASVTIEGVGFSEEAVLEIFDIMGRKVYTASFSGSHTWSGYDMNGLQVPCGTYTVLVHDGLSGRATLRLLRL
ncbi:MAG: hypothetical protein ABFR50_05620 [Candidatus Fermentibacteria bacterium]